MESKKHIVSFNMNQTQSGYIITSIEITGTVNVENLKENFTVSHFDPFLAQF